MLTLTDKTFESHMEGPVLVMFTADFAGPCKNAKQRFLEARGRRGNQIKFALFDLDGNPRIPTRFNVRQLPLFMRLDDGIPKELVAGDVPVERIVEMCDE